MWSMSACSQFAVSQILTYIDVLFTCLPRHGHVTASAQANARALFPAIFTEKVPGGLQGTGAALAWPAADNGKIR